MGGSYRIRVTGVGSIALLACGLERFSGGMQFRLKRLSTLLLLRERRPAFSTERFEVSPHACQLLVRVDGFALRHSSPLSLLLVWSLSVGLIQLLTLALLPTCTRRFLAVWRD